MQFNGCSINDFGSTSLSLSSHTFLFLILDHVRSESRQVPTTGDRYSPSIQQPQETFFIDIDALQDQGSPSPPYSPPLSSLMSLSVSVSAQDIAKLKGAGFATVVGIIQATKKTLTKIKVSLSTRE